ncbi:hypothetical protein M0N77_13095 [Psychrobacter sp. AH5]|uniref:hypothetical protein n=1 Tax=Psychrobacter sp. AH5 TaxID=2937433 RepID=UPI003340569B
MDFGGGRAQAGSVANSNSKLAAQKLGWRFGGSEIFEPALQFQMISKVIVTM